MLNGREVLITHVVCNGTRKESLHFFLVQLNFSDYSNLTESKKLNYQVSIWTFGVISGEKLLWRSIKWLNNGRYRRSVFIWLSLRRACVSQRPFLTRNCSTLFWENGCNLFLKVYTITDHKNYTMKCSKLGSKTTFLRLVVTLEFVTRHLYGPLERV